MNFKKTLFFFFFCFIIGVNGQAKIIDDVIAPVTNSDARTVLLVGSSITLATALFKSSFVKSTQRELQEGKPLCCSVTKWGNDFLQIAPNAIYVIGFGLHTWLKDSETSKQRAIGMTKATLYSGLFTDVLKPLVSEQRPNGGKHSFPSGHTTTAFAFASFVAVEHPWYYGVPAYFMASFVGFSRMHDNYHYLHDVMAGATIGMSYGIAMAEKARGGDSNTAFVIAPAEKFDGLEFKLARAF